MIAEQPSLLIVDDDTVFCEVLAKAMAKRGFDVTSAHNTASALEKIETLMPYALS